MNEIRLAAKRIKEADAVLVGASNGLSIAEGLHLFADNEAFEELFGDFKEKYGLRCILHGMGARWPSQQEKWGFWSRLIHCYCGKYQKSAVMSDLRAIIGDKDYFVVTSNGEGHFQLSGFVPENIYEVEGNWLNMQCVRRCHDVLYPTLELAEKMAEAELDGRIPADLVPCCPVCGGPMQIHMIMDENFIPEKENSMRYKRFLEQYRGKKLAVLELGIGWRNQLIKGPFMRLVDREANASYITINRGEVYIPEKIRQKSLGLDGPLEEILAEIRAEYETSDGRSVEGNH